MSAPGRPSAAAIALSRSHKLRTHVIAEEREGVGLVTDRERAAELVGGPSRMAVTEGIKRSSISRRMSTSHCSARSGGFGFRHQLVEMPVGLTFELIDPTLGLPQLSR